MKTLVYGNDIKIFIRMNILLSEFKDAEENKWT